jgi:hypothetical protein
MPTGYTADVQSGKITTLNDYAKLCARAFGALIALRDEPMNAQIPESFKPETSYHEAAIAHTQKVLNEVPYLSLAECDARAEAEYQERVEWIERYAREKAEQKARYEAMLKQVKAWHVPEELRGLKVFMASQLEESIRFDCGEYQPPAPVRLTGAEWRDQKIEQAQAELARCKKNIDEEIASVESHNAWLASLRAALAE